MNAKARSCALVRSLYVSTRCSRFPFCEALALSVVVSRPFNPWPASPYACSSDEQILRFGKLLLDAGLSTNVRWPKGRDIMAACGQLQSKGSAVVPAAASPATAHVAPL